MSYIKANDVLVNADFIEFLIREKMDTICEGNCDDCIFNFGKQKYNVSTCDKFTFKQLYDISYELYKRRNE